MVQWCTPLLRAPDMLQHIVLAIGTSTHSDGHLRSPCYAFYTSSPDDKSHFPYRRSGKELGENN